MCRPLSKNAFFFKGELCVLSSSSTAPRNPLKPVKKTFLCCAIRAEKRFSMRNAATQYRRNAPFRFRFNCMDFFRVFFSNLFSDRHLHIPHWQVWWHPYKYNNVVHATWSLQIYGGVRILITIEKLVNLVNPHFRNIFHFVIIKLQQLAKDCSFISSFSCIRHN